MTRRPLLLCAICASNVGVTETPPNRPERSSDRRRCWLPLREGKRLAGPLSPRGGRVRRCYPDARVKQEPESQLPCKAKLEC